MIPVYFDGDSGDVFRLGIKANLDKTKAMICMPGFIWGEWGDMV